MSPIGDTFGPIKTRTQIVEAVEATLQRWETEYLAEVERQHGLPKRALPRIRAWERSAQDVRKHVGSNLPCVVVRCPSLAGDPQRRSSGTDVKWAVVVSVVCTGQSQAESERNADLYTAAFRALLEHNHSLGGVASGCAWVDERYDEIPSRDRDNLGAGSIIFEVEVEGAVRSKAGPVGDPLADPYDNVRDQTPEVADGSASVTVTIETE